MLNQTVTSSKWPSVIPWCVYLYRLASPIIITISLLMGDFYFLQRVHYPPSNCQYIFQIKDKQDKLLYNSLNTPTQWKYKTKSLNPPTRCKSDNLLAECCSAGFLRLIFVFHVISQRVEPRSHLSTQIRVCLPTCKKDFSFNLLTFNLPWIILRCKNITNYQRSTYCGDEMKTCSLAQTCTGLINCDFKHRRDRLFNFVWDPGPTHIRIY